MCLPTPASHGWRVPPAAQILKDQNGDLSEEDVIPNRASLLVFSRRGFIKRMPADLFAAQVCMGA